MSTAPVSPPAPSIASTKRLLNIVLAVGIADLVLFLALMYVAVVDRNESLIGVLGPIHGFGFVVLVGLTTYGAVQARWGWWFPAITLITTGPPGSIIGDLILRRRLERDGTTAHVAHGTAADTSPRTPPPA